MPLEVSVFKNNPILKVFEVRITPHGAGKVENGT